MESFNEAAINQMENKALKNKTTKSTEKRLKTSAISYIL